MGRSTKRRQNQCNSCHYTWSPRGHSVSLQCPNCGSRNVGFVPFSFAGLIVSMILAVFLCGGGCFLLSVFFGMSKDNSSDPLTGIQNPNTPGIASSTTSVVAQTDPQPTIDNPDPDPPTTPPPDADFRIAGNGRKKNPGCGLPHEKWTVTRLKPIWLAGTERKHNANWLRRRRQRSTPTKKAQRRHWRLPKNYVEPTRLIRQLSAYRT